MKNWIVKVRGQAGDQWISVTATDPDDVRLRLASAGSGYIPLSIFENVAQAKNQYPEDGDLLNQQSFPSLGTLPMAFTETSDPTGLPGPINPWRGSQDDPLIAEGVGGRYGGASAAWNRALDSIGYDQGVLRSIADTKRQALGAYGQLGFIGRSDAPGFQNLGEGRELQDFYTGRLKELSGGRASGTPSWSLTGAAKNLFDQNPGKDLSAFYNPVLGSAAGGDTGDFTGDDAARMVAELGLTGYGRGRFGALGGYLPSADKLVQDYAAQPVGTAVGDIRDYIRTRLGGG